MIATRRVRCLPFALCALALAACAPTPAAQIKTELKTMEAEQTVEKLVTRGKGFASVGDYTRAEQYLAAALTKGAPPSKVLPTLLNVCIAEQRYRVAIEYAEPELQKHPKDVHLRFVVASLYKTIGDLSHAERELTQVIEDKPDFAAAHFALAVLLRDDKSDRVAADPHFREYLRLEPGGPHADEAQGSLLKSVP